MKNLTVFVLVGCFNIFAMMSNCNAADVDPGWRWRDSLDFKYSIDETVYSTTELKGTSKITITFDGKSVASLDSVHRMLSEAATTLADKLLDTSSKNTTKKGPNVALGVIGTLLKSRDSLTLSLEYLREPETKEIYFFPSAFSSKTITIDEKKYYPGVYNLWQKEDRESFFDFIIAQNYQEATDLISVIREKEKEFTTLKGKISSVQLPLELPDAFHAYQKDTWATLATKLTTDKGLEEKKDKVNHAAIRDLICRTCDLACLKGLHEALDALIRQLTSQRWVDSEKYLLARYNATKHEDLDGILVRTLHIHSNLDMCVHCAGCFSQYYRRHTKIPVIPFVSSKLPYEENRRLFVGEDSHEGVILGDFLRPRVYPCWLIDTKRMPLINELPPFTPVIPPL